MLKVSLFFLNFFVLIGIINLSFGELNDELIEE